MKKVITYSAVSLFLLFGLIVVVFDNPTITGATTSENRLCVDPASALNYINIQGCTRIYEDAACTSAGNVQVVCVTEIAPPITETPQPAPTPPSTETQQNNNTQQQNSDKNTPASWRSKAQIHRPFYNLGQFLRWLWYRIGGSYY